MLIVILTNRFKKNIHTGLKSSSEQRGWIVRLEVSLKGMQCYAVLEVVLWRGFQ